MKNQYQGSGGFCEEAYKRECAVTIASIGLDHSVHCLRKIRLNHGNALSHDGKMILFQFFFERLKADDPAGSFGNPNGFSCRVMNTVLYVESRLNIGLTFGSGRSQQNLNGFE